MKGLTFKGFITQHVKTLSNENTISIFKLAKEASTTNPKLVEPLLLYAATVGKTKMLLSATKNTALNEHYQKIINKYLNGVETGTIQERISSMPHKYKTVYDEFLIAESKNKADNPLKESYKKQIERLVKENSLNFSFLAKETGLKRGNIYKFFSKNQQNCLSLNTLETMLTYLEKNYPATKGDG